MDISGIWPGDAPGGGFAAVGGVVKWAFFKLIFDFLDHEVETFRDNMLGGMFTWVGGIALSLLVIWIFFQGYRVMTGQSRDSLMVLVSNSLRATLIVSVATSMAFGSTDLYRTFTDGMPAEVMKVVTGEEADPVDSIDDSLRHMQIAFIGIDALSGDNASNKDDKDRALMMTGIGVAGPSVVGGALLLMNKIALGLFIGLGPLFVLCLLFDQTRQLFSRWLYYGIGTMFSLGVLSFMVAVAMKMTLAVAGAFAVQYALAMASGTPPAEGVSSMAMQQGGLGLILTVLLIMTPPMAANFFQGVLGHFASHSAFGSVGDRSVDAAGRLPHQPGYSPQPGGSALQQQVPKHDYSPSVPFGVTGNGMETGGGARDQVKRSQAASND